MTLVILSFASGVLLLQAQAALPSPAWIWLAPLCLVGSIANKRLTVPLAAVLGFCWALGLAHFKMADRLAPELEGKDVEVVGIVASLPAIGERSLRFEFEPEMASVDGVAAALPGKILLSWYRSAAYEDQPSLLAEPVHPGERWRLTVRLRRPHGQLNPHGFDYEAWLLERGVGGTGYVRSSKKSFPEKLGERNSFSDRIEQIRERVRDRFKRVLGETPAGGILAALAVGDQRAISSEEWRLFNRTGVTHLMSICCAIEIGRAHV